MKSILTYLNEVWSGEQRAYRNHARKGYKHFAKHVTAKDLDSESRERKLADRHFDKAHKAKKMIGRDKKRDEYRYGRAAEKENKRIKVAIKQHGIKEMWGGEHSAYRAHTRASAKASVQGYSKGFTSHLAKAIKAKRLIPQDPKRQEARNKSPYHNNKIYRRIDAAQKKLKGS